MLLINGLQLVEEEAQRLLREWGLVTAGLSPTDFWSWWQCWLDRWIPRCFANSRQGDHLQATNRHLTDDLLTGADVRMQRVRLLYLPRLMPIQMPATVMASPTKKMKNTRYLKSPCDNICISLKGLPCSFIASAMNLLWKLNMVFTLVT